MNITSSTTVQDESAPMYYRNSSYAHSHGEFQQFSDSQLACAKCRSDIEDTVNSIHEQSEFLNPDIYRPLVKKYGLERVAYTLYNAIGVNYFGNRESFSSDNRRWTIEMYTPYFLLNNSHPPHFLQLRCPVDKLDQFVSVFRNSFNIPLNNLKWEHERGEEYPEICRYSIYDSKDQTEAWTWMYSLIQSEDCAHDLYLIADSCASKDAATKYLTETLDNYGPERTFTILGEAGLIARNDHESSIPLLKENLDWIEKYDSQYSFSDIDYSQKGRLELFNLSESPAGLNDLLSIAHEIGTDLKDMNKFTPAFLYGAPVFYSEERLHDYEICDPIFKNCYDLRGSDDDPGIPVTVENHVTVNYCGSILSPARLPMPEQGYLKLGEDGLLMDEPNVDHDYLYGLVLSYGNGNLEEGMIENMRTENEKLVVQTEPNDLDLSPGCMFGVYRISDENCQHKFKNFNATQDEQLPVVGREYSLIYFSDMERSDMSCEEILKSLREDPPASFHAYGPYTSDVIVTNNYGDVKAFYVSIDHSVDADKQIHEKISFNDLPDFIFQRQLLLYHTPMRLLDDQPIDIREQEEETLNITDEPAGHGAR